MSAADIKPMGQVECGACTACCSWGDGAARFAPILGRRERDNYQTFKRDDGLYRLASTPYGDCVYLSPKGCSIHAKRPRYCRTFDCRSAFESVLARGGNHTVLQILVQGGVNTALDRSKL